MSAAPAARLPASMFSVSSAFPSDTNPGVTSTRREGKAASTSIAMANPAGFEL